MKKTIFKKHISFKPSRPGGGTFHLTIELREKTNKCRDWDSLEFVENPIELSICGRTRGGSGQCSDSIEKKIGNFNKDEQVIIRKILDIWKEYHLNDMKAGTKYQTELLSDFKNTSSGSYHTEASAYLKSKNALYDRDYEYGTSWLYKEIPNDVIEFLESL